MNVIGVSYNPEGICFAKSDNKIATNTLYINEFIDIFRKNGICDIGFSYKVVGDKVIPVYTPEILQYTMAGKVMKKVDDYLKIILNELSAIYLGEEYLKLIKDKTVLPNKISTSETDTIVTGISMEPSQVIVNKTGNTIELVDIVLKLNYWRQNHKSGASLPFTNYEIQFLNQYMNEDIPNLCRIEAGHPYNHLKRVLVAQHIAKFIVQNTPITTSATIRKEVPDLSVPIRMTRRDTQNIVFGLNQLAIKSIDSNVWHEFQYSGSNIKYKKLELVNPTSSCVTKINSLSSEGGIKSESNESKYVQRGFTGHTPSAKFSYVVYKDDSKKCAELKMFYNGIMARVESFSSDAKNEGELVADCYVNYKVITTYPDLIVKYCAAH
jgi:hypothetical protein